MDGMARVNDPCVVTWAEGLARSTVRYDTSGTVARRGTAKCHAGRVSARHGGQLYVYSSLLLVLCFPHPLPTIHG
jgi:hypothetical protein